jgi:hypothetical protein
MAWQDDVNAYKLVPITTGDGETYDLKMKFKGGSIDPLTASYNYPGKIGSKPKRNSCASPVYDLTLFIPQDLFVKFKNSICDPSGEWLVKHPLYGDLKGQPTTLSWDNVKLDDVEFTIQFQESIKDDTPLVLTDYRERILTQNIFIEEITVTAFALTEPSIEEIGKLEQFINDLEELYDSVLNNEYVNKLYDIRQTIQDTVFNSLKFMDQANDLLKIGSTLSFDGILSPLKTRLDIMIGQNSVIVTLDEIVSTLTPDGNISDVIALFKEFSGATNMAAIAVTVATPAESQNAVSGFDVTDVSDVGATSDYRYKSDVDATILETNQLLNDYIIALDAIDIETQGFIKYSPNDTLNTAVNNTIILSIQEIKEISVKAKEASVYVTIKDTIPEILAFELYGIATDENVQEIIDGNDLFGKNSIKNSWRNFVIKKNTEIIYYA